MRPRSFDRHLRNAWSPSGFTLVEVLVAIVLIEVGLLALTSASGIVVREAMLARARLAALEIGRNRVETIAATRCSALTGGAVARSGYREDWFAALIPVDAREIRDSVTFTIQRVVRTVVFHTKTPCAP